MWRCDVAHVMWCHQIWPRPSTKSGTATSPNASKLCACPTSCNPRCCSGHQQNHINIIRCCPGHCIITKFCPCKEKSCPKITKCHACDEKWHSNMPQKNIPTSPNVAPATQNDWHAWYAPHMKRHAHCAGQQASPSNCYEKWHSEMKHERNLPKTAEAAFTLADDSTIEHLAPACSPRLFFCALKMHFTTLRALAIYPNCTKYYEK